jgi:integrase
MGRKRRGRGESSISQRTDGLWEAKVSLGYDGTGKRRRKTVYGKTKVEVQEKLRKLHNAVVGGLVEDTDHLTLAMFVGMWLDTVRQNVCRSTYQRYEQHVRLHLTPHLGGVRLNKLEAVHVAGLYAELEKAGVSASERKKVATVLRMALRQATRLRLIAHNPALDVPRRRATKQEMKVLDLEAVPLFPAAAAADRLYALYVLALDTGMRQGELFGLRWPDIDFEKGCVMIQRSLEEIGGSLNLKDVKTAQARPRVQLSPVTLAALNDHRARMLAEGHVTAEAPVFCDTEGKWLRKSNFANRSFKPILRRAGLTKIRFHDLRHTAASLLLLAGENAKVISERLGHASSEITLNTYSHVLPTMQQGAAEKMGFILGQKPPEKQANPKIGHN